jgi:hypothetical protein
LFRSDLEAFVPRETVEASVMRGIRELPPMPGLSYVGFADPSGGSSDSFTLAVAHAENGRGVLDLIREIRPPFSPESVVIEYAAVLKSYGIYRVTGDRYAGIWPTERFQQHGISYEPAEKSKSDWYRELLPLLNSARVDLLDHDRCTNQLCSLERRSSRGTGRDIIDKPTGSHDDVANSVAGALVLVAGGDDEFTIVRRYLIGNEALE